MSDFTLTPTTELEAVNFMLISIGEQPVNTLTDSGAANVSIAQSLLHQTSREIQTVGLASNTEKEYPLALNDENEIPLPNNTLKVDASNVTKDIVQRGKRLYNREEQTYKFDDTLDCDLVLFLGFEELPQVARNYITIRAARIFQTKTVGSQAMYELSLRDEMEARVAFVSVELDVEDHNMLRNPEVALMNRRSW